MWNQDKESLIEGKKYIVYVMGKEIYPWYIEVERCDEIYIAKWDGSRFKLDDGHLNDWSAWTEVPISITIMGVT